MPSVLIVADTIRSPELRHEVPLPAPDPMIYVERNGTRRVFAGSLEIPRLAELEGLAPSAFEELGIDELYAGGGTYRMHEPELVLRACRLEGIVRAAVPRGFPLVIADYLRANGIELDVDADLFERRRRSKNESELAGIRRAARASEQAFARAKELLAAAGDLTCEGIRAEVMRVFTEAGVVAPDPPIISHGAQTAVGHDPGSGPIAPGEAVVLDLYPQDPESGCYSDMTRTFCIGPAPDELRRYWELSREAMERSLAAIRSGVAGAEVHRVASEVFSDAGYPTQLTKEPGQVLDEGFYHGLGHGVGLEVHEDPGLGRNGVELVAGDVVAVEPGCYRPGFGGCRLEDIVLVTEDGCEPISSFPYDLEV
jgi:Xaa-Pro aminopeptidase